MVYKERDINKYISLQVYKSDTETFLMKGGINMKYKTFNMSIVSMSFLFSFSIFFLAIVCATDVEAATAQWKPTSGMTITQVNSTDLKISGTLAAKNYSYATLPLPFSKLEPGATYRLEGWMNLSLLSDTKYPPGFRVDAMDATGKYLTSYGTCQYGTLGMSTWQKLWAEFTVYDDRTKSGYIAVHAGTNNPLTIALYVRDVALNKIKSSISFPTSTYVPDAKLNDVFWPFKKSDVIAFVPGTVDNYKDYGVSFVSWGTYPAPDASSIVQYCKTINDAAKVGTKIGAKIETRSSSPYFMKRYSDSDIKSAQTRDLNGNPIIVPDMTNVRTRGYPAYWFSINNSTFRDFLKGNAERAMQCKPYGLMVDEPLGEAPTVWWGTGEYSDNGIIGFRKYLKSNFTSEQLAKNGISNIDSFDIKKNHQMYAEVPSENRPFRKEFIDFMLKSSLDLYKEITSNAVAKLGQRIPLGANLDPTYQYSGRLLMDVDYYSFECTMNAKSGNPFGGDSLLAFKMADALRRPAALMGSGEDHAFVQDNNLPGMIRCWIAEAHAFGNYFMAPYKLWAYTPAKGSYSYQPRSNRQLAPMYQFIRNHAYLFDDYQVVAPTAFALSYTSYLRNKKGASVVVKNLSDQSIPFNIVIAGDDVLGLHLSTSQLAVYENLIVPDGSILSTEDSAVLQSMKNSGKALVKDPGALNKSSQIVINGVTGVRATLRAVRNDNTKPVVVHMINGDYDVGTDSCSKKQDFIISIPKKLLTKPVSQVNYVRPPSWDSRALSVTNEYPDVALDFIDVGASIEITVPFLDVWGILVLS